MPNRIIDCALPCLFAATLITGCSPSADESSQSANALAHIERARELAGSDVTAPFEFFCVAGNARGTNRDAAIIEPVQLFDNLYVVGNTDTVVYAITTSAGIILIDSGLPATTESVIEPGLVALGLDPATVRYVLLGHGHADHYGGAAYFQSRYGARVGAMSPDWTLIEDTSDSAASAPNRDLVIIDGARVTLGDTSITPVAIPGHTPGSLAFIFPVTDRGTSHVAGLFGGTILLADRITTPGLEQYVDSIAHYLDVATDMNVDVEVQNHPVFDDMPEKLAVLAARGPGAPHPFVLETERYARFWNVISECIRAEIARRNDDG